MEDFEDADAAFEVDDSEPRLPNLDFAPHGKECTATQQTQDQQHVGQEPVYSEGLIGLAKPERRGGARRLRLAQLCHLDDSTKAKVSRSVQTAYVKDWLHSHGYVVKADKLHPAVARVIEEWFQLVDEDDSKTIEHHELLAALKAAKIPCDDATIKEMIQMMDMNKDGVVDWEEFEVFMTEEFAAGKSLLSGEYILPSGLSINFGVMIGKLKRNRLLRDIMHNSRRRNKWAAIASDPRALGRELATMQEAAEATTLTLEHLNRSHDSNLVMATPRTRLTTALLRASIDSRPTAKLEEPERSIRDKLRAAALGREVLRFPEALEKDGSTAAPSRAFPDPTAAPAVPNRTDETPGDTDATDAADTLMQPMSYSSPGDFAGPDGGSGAGGGAVFGLGLSRSATPGVGLSGAARGFARGLRPSSSFGPVPPRPASSHVATYPASTSLPGLASQLRERFASPTRAPMHALPVPGTRAAGGGGSAATSTKVSNGWRPTAVANANGARRPANGTAGPARSRSPGAVQRGGEARANGATMGAAYSKGRSISPVVGWNRPTAVAVPATSDQHRAHAATGSGAPPPPPPPPHQRHQRHSAPRAMSQVGLLAEEMLASAARPPMEASGVPAGVLAGTAPAASTNRYRSGSRSGGAKAEGPAPGLAVEVPDPGSSASPSPSPSMSRSPGPVSPYRLSTAAAAGKHGAESPAVGLYTYDSKGLPILTHPHPISDFMVAIRGQPGSCDASPTPGGSRATTGVGQARVSMDGEPRSLTPGAPPAPTSEQPPTPQLSSPPSEPRLSSGGGLSSHRAARLVIPAGSAGSGLPPHPGPSSSPGLLSSYGCVRPPAEGQLLPAAAAGCGADASSPPDVAPAAAAVVVVVVAASAAGATDASPRSSITVLDLADLPSQDAPLTARSDADGPPASKTDVKRLSLQLETAQPLQPETAQPLEPEAAQPLEPEAAQPLEPARPVDAKRQRSTSHSGSTPHARPSWGTSVLSPAIPARLGPILAMAAPINPDYGYQSRALGKAPTAQAAEFAALHGVASAVHGGSVAADKALRHTSSLPRIHSTDPTVQAQAKAGAADPGPTCPAGDSAVEAAAAATAVGEAKDAGSASVEHKTPAGDTVAGALEDGAAAPCTVEGDRRNSRRQGSWAHHARQVERAKTYDRPVAGPPKHVASGAIVSGVLCELRPQNAEGAAVLRVALPLGAVTQPRLKRPPPGTVPAAAMGGGRHGTGDSSDTPRGGARPVKGPIQDGLTAAKLTLAAPAVFGTPGDWEAQSPLARAPRATSGSDQMRSSSTSSRISCTDSSFSSTASTSTSAARFRSFHTQDAGIQRSAAEADCICAAGTSPFLTESVCGSEANAGALTAAMLGHTLAERSRAASPGGGQRPPSRARTPVGGRSDREDAGWSASTASLLQLRLSQQFND